MTKLPFVKMQGLGNDYVYVDAIRNPFPMSRAPELARAWSDRHFGIGSDGLILLVPGDRTPVGMRMWNADGSEGAMCGNGLRCLAVLARELGHVDVDRFVLDSPSGHCAVELLRDAGGAVERVAAEVGAVRVETAPQRVALGHGTLEYHRGDAGNPHAVVWVTGDLDGHPVAEIGAALQSHPDFPGGVNVEFVQVDDAGRLLQRTWERGSGETLACGSGAATAALLALELGRVRGPDVLVRLRGGDLEVRAGDGSLVIVGPARTVFRGEIDLHEQS